MTKLILQPSQDNNLAITQSFDFQVQQYIYTIKRDLSVSTYKTYSNKLDVFIAWYKETPIRTDIKEHLKEFKAWLKNKYNSPKSINLLLSVVRSFYKWLFKNSLIDHLPTAALDNVKDAEGHSKSALDKYQLADLVKSINSHDTIEGKRNRLIVLMGVMNGLRVNELANILIEDISFKDGDYVIYLLRKGYESKSCYTILNPSVYAELKEFIGDKKEGVLFASVRTNLQLTSDSISRIIKKELRHAGIDSKAITAHSLRHTFARLALDSNVPIMQIMTALNHKNLSTTQIYARTYERHAKSAEKSIKLDF